MKVLVADDDSIARRTIVHALEQGGYDVLTAGDGREALDLLQEHPIQLVVSDWNMPRIDGVALCRAIRTEFAEEAATEPFEYNTAAFALPLKKEY